jgi:MAternally-affected-uncoordination protein
LIQRNPNDLQLTMQPCASLIETCQTNNLNQIESLKVFFLVLQVTYFLQCGQMKSVRNTLKSLQHYIQSLTTREESDTNTGSTVLENFQWLPKDLLGLLAYLLTVIHSIQTGCFDKAIKFSEKALINIQKLKLKDEQMNLTITNKFKFITEKFNLLFFENQIRSNIALGNRSEAIKQIGDAFILCDQDPLLMNMYCAQLHCLLGIYASSINQREMALTHFNQALKTSTDSDMWLYCVMNLAVCYLNSMATHPNSKNQFFSIVDNVTPEKIQTQNTALNSLSHLFRALKLHLNSNQQQAQESLKEAILLANSEELSNVACNSFLLIGHISFSMNQFQECFNMLTNGVDLADKMSDLSLRIYGTSLLKGDFLLKITRLKNNFNIRKTFFVY